MYCRHCGVQLKEGHKFCPKCGSKVKITEEPKKKTKKGKKIIALICCGAVLLTGVVGGIYGISFKKNNKQTSKEESNSDFIAMDGGFDTAVTDEQSALKAIAEVSDVIGIDDVNTELSQSNVQECENIHFYRFEQMYDSIPVFGRSISLAADQDGTVCALTSNFSEIEKKIELNYSAEEIVHKIDKQLKADNASVIGTPKLYYYYNDEVLTLVYFIDATNSLQYIVDAHSGNLLDIKTTIVQAQADCLIGDEKNTCIQLNSGEYLIGDFDRKIVVFNADNKECLKDSSYQKDVVTPMTSDDNVFGNNDQFETHDFLVGCRARDFIAKMADFYHGINSEQNTAAIITINNAFEPDNAFGSYEEISTITDKDIGLSGSVNSIIIGTNRCNNLEEQIDTFGHEYTHGITESQVNWDYNRNGETGALSEAYSDIFGEILESNYSKKPIDWINDDRNMMKPYANSKVHPYPSTMDDIRKASESKEYVDSFQGDGYLFTDDNSTCTDYAHFACEVVSHAAYLMWNGIDENEAQKISDDLLARIWYNSLFILPSSPNFNSCRSAVELSARIMMKNGKLTSEQYACVQAAFDEVGITANTINYRKTVKNNFVLKVEDSVGKETVDYEYHIYRFSDASEYYVNALKSRDSEQKLPTAIQESNLSNGPTTVALEDGDYLLIVRDAIEGSNKMISCKIIVDGKNKNAVDEVILKTDFGKDDNPSAYKAYAKLYQEKADQLGEIKTNADPRYDILRGVCFADLIDFNNDGLDEFVIMYYDSEKPSVQYGVKYFYEVWGYQGGKPILLGSGKPFSSNGGVCTAIFTEKEGQKYLVSGATDGFDNYYFNGFDGDEFKCVLSCEEEYGEWETYMLNGEQSTAEETQSIREQWLENSERYILTTWPYENNLQKIIKKMQQTKKALGLDSGNTDNPKTIEGSEVTVCGTLALPQYDYGDRFNSTQNNYYQLDLPNDCVFSVSGVKVTTDKIKLCSTNEFFSFSAEMQGLNVKVKGILELQPDANADQQAVIRVETIEFIL